MATGETAPPVALSSSPPPLLDHSPSNLSSPLSDVEDKDADPDEMELGLPSRDSAHLATPEPPDEEDDDDSASKTDSDVESKLSEVDVNDSEAETERLYDTPPKNNVGRDIVNGAQEPTGEQLIFERRIRNFEPSPSKLQQQIRLDVDAENKDEDEDDGSDNESLSDADDDASMASSDVEQEAKLQDESRSPSPVKTTPQTATQESDTPSGGAKQDSLGTRKRKRSSVADRPEIEQPLRKRTGSVGVLDREVSADDTAVLNGEGGSTNMHIGEHSGDEDDDTADGELPGSIKNKDEAAPSVENVTEESSRSKKAKRNGTKPRQSPDDGGGGVEGPNESTQEDAETATADEDGVPTADEGHMDVDADADADADGDADADADADEEAELAHKNEEELERKKAAWEELAAIEKQFSSFRERLYQERLDQLNQEEAMLLADNPTHPEYLAMLQCIDERRDERIRISTLELRLKMDVLKRRAVAERAQIMSQFHQSVRASRERVLEELGREWYEIQHERRRIANSIPDFGIRFPAAKAQNIRHAVAYNKEVSILSGFAKHVGFPAAPPIAGASEDQIENDFETFARGRQRASSQPFHPGHADIAVGVPFGRTSLGPAGEQFLEQTPWANPNHPAHQLQRQHSHQPDQAPASSSYAATPAVNRRHSHQPGSASSPTTSFNVFLNGVPGAPMHKSHSAAGHENVMKSSTKMVVDAMLKRELSQVL